MVIVFKKKTPGIFIENIIKKLSDRGLNIHRSTDADRVIIIVLGDKKGLDISDIETMDGVLGIHRITDPFLKVSREYKPKDTVIKVGDISIGRDIAVIAGPCTIEGYDQLYNIAKALKNRGIRILRGGAFKPRKSPYAFQGMGREGLEIMRDIANELDMYIISEILDIRDIEFFSNIVDIIQVGSRNMNNYPLLKELGGINRPIVLKRGMSATIEEWLLASEYIYLNGNSNIILCERGIKSFETMTRFSLDLASIPIINIKSHLPVIVDPSHCTGNRNIVVPLAKAAIAAGAHGLMVEVHDNPEEALCDGAQSLYPHQFNELMDDIDNIAIALKKKIIY